jgi:protoporphyrinogen oxidase
MYDVVVIGGGTAGTATAYFLRDLKLDVCVLEATGEVGGRSNTVDLAGASANSGALFIYRNTRTEELAAELGLDVVPFEPTTYGIHVNGETIVAETNEDLVARLDLTDSEKTELSEFIESALREYHEYTSDGVLDQDEHGRLATETIAERLTGLRPAVRDIIDAAMRGGAVGDPAKLSAKYALRYFASYLAREKHNRSFALGGMQAIPRAMHTHLAEGTVRFDSEVTGVRFDEEQGVYEVTFTGPNGTETLLTRHVVSTLPAPVVPSVFDFLPPWKVAALNSFDTPGSTTLNIVADIDGLPDIADWAFIVTVGTPFDAVINPTPGRSGPHWAAGKVQFTCYGNSAGFQPGFAEDEDRVAGWVESFLEVAPQLRGRILGVHARTWQHCFALLGPDRTANLADLQASVGSLHFAGDYTSETAGTHGAYTEAERVASLIRASVAAAGN